MSTPLPIHQRERLVNLQTSYQNPFYGEVFQWFLPNTCLFVSEREPQAAIHTMMIIFLSILLTVLSWHTASSDLVLSEKIMKLTSIGAALSNLAYENDPPRSSDFDSLTAFHEEPDQALVVSTAGYCFAAFRGTTLTWEDWQQNFKVGTKDICTTTASSTTCCSTRTGFWQAYNTRYRSDLEVAIRKCASTCSDPNECVVLTGHSQGGAVAAVAAVYLNDLNPYVITFGQPPTVMAPCPKISSERWYRFVNTKVSSAATPGQDTGGDISYDPVPFAPGLGADNFGHMIILSNDPSGVAYIGLDVQDSFSPLNVNGFDAHFIQAAKGSPYPGYLDRIQHLMQANGTYPIRTTGFIDGSLCTKDEECESFHCSKETKFAYSRCVGTECKGDDECSTGRCDSGLCVPKLGSCQPCDENSDCIHGHCSLFFRCSGPNGLMDDQCSCRVDSECASGRCEGVAPPICEPQLPVGALCNEDSDCLSGHCSWWFRCEVAFGSSHASQSSLTIPEHLRSAQLKEKSITQYRHLWKSISLIIVVCALGVIAYYWFLRNRRHGYERIPAELNV